MERSQLSLAKSENSFYPDNTETSDVDGRHAVMTLS
jgi:hypothetical protein